MDFTLPPAHAALQSRARSFAERVLRPTIAAPHAERPLPAGPLPLPAAQGFPPHPLPAPLLPGN